MLELLHLLGRGVGNVTSTENCCDNADSSDNSEIQSYIWRNFTFTKILTYVVSGCADVLSKCLLFCDPN